MSALGSPRENWYLSALRGGRSKSALASCFSPKSRRLFAAASRGSCKLRCNQTAFVFHDCSPAYSIEVLSAPFDPLWKAFQLDNAGRECLPIEFVNTSVPSSSNGRYL